jgi:hypothetical protein
MGGYVHRNEMMAMRVDVVPWGESPALLNKWRECVATSDNFRACLQVPEWIDYRWRDLTSVYVGTLRDAQSNDLFAVTPLVEHEYELRFSTAGLNLGSVKLKGLLLNGNVPLFPNSHEYYEALCDAVLGIPWVECLYMLGVPTCSPFWDFLTKSRDLHSRWLIYTPYSQPAKYLFIDMSLSYEQYLSKFKSKTRQTFARKLRYLERGSGGNLELLRVSNVEGVESFLRAACSIAKVTWQRHLVDLDVDQPAKREEFLQSMASRGLLRSYLLEANGKAIAFLIGFQTNGIFYFHETGFDPSYARFSPGLVLLNLVIKDCFEHEKPKIFHFGTGESYYKNLLANQVGEENTILILRNSAKSQMKVASHSLFTKGIELIKKWLRVRT